MSKLKKTTLYVKGMHCPSCDILITDTFKDLPNVKEVKTNHQTQEAQVCYTGCLDTQKLNQKISHYGYQITDRKSELKPVEPLTKRLTDAGVIAMMLFIAFFFLQEFRLLPDMKVTSSLSLTSAFILGLVASTSTCMATSGALFLSTIGTLTSRERSLRENLVPAVSFNIGRVLSYGGFGFIFGLIGKTLVSNLQLGSFLSLIVSISMILIGLDMLKIFSVSSVLPASLNKALFKKLEHKLIQSPRQTSLFLGAITYLLPCGFTQAVQIYALGLADPVQSAIIMMVFALGTVPALIMLGFASSSFTRYSFYPMFQKIVAVLVLLIGISYIGNTLTLYGMNFGVLSFGGIIPTAETSDSHVKIKDGVQVVTMNVSARGYEPSSFTIKQNVPVRWIVNGENVFGCQGTLVAPKVNIAKPLAVGENIIEFTAKEKGTLAFSCSMGMIRGQFNVI